MPRSYALNRAKQQVTSSPLNQLFFDPTSTIQSGIGAFDIPSDVQLLEELIQGWANFFDGAPGSLETLVTQALAWLDSAIGLNLVDLQSGLNDILAALQQSWLNFQQLINGIAGEIDSDVAAALTVWNRLLGDFTASSEAFSILLSSWWTALQTDTGAVLVTAWETAWNTYISTVTSIASDEQITLTNFFNALLGISTVTIGQVTGVTETIYPRPGGRGALAATARATKFVQIRSWSGQGILVGVVTTVIPGMPREAESGYIFGRGVLTASAHSAKFNNAASLSGHGVLSVYVTTAVFGPKFAEVGNASGRGVLTATAKATQFRETDFLSGRGVLSGQATTIYGAIIFGGTGYELGSLHGVGALRAVAGASKFTGLTSALSGRGVLTAYVTTVIPGMPRYSEPGATAGRGALTAVANSNEFRETPTLSGRGALAAQATTVYTGTHSGTGFEQGRLAGRGVLTAVVNSTKFSGLTGASAGRGLLTPYVTTVIPGWPREAETCTITGRGVLTATAKATQFRETPALSGRGLLTAQATTVVYGNQFPIEGLSPQLAGRGVLAAVANATKFSSLTGAPTGRGLLTAYVTTVIPGMPRFAEKVPATGSGVLTATAKATQFRETDFLSGRGLLTAQATTIFGAGGIASEAGPVTGRGVLTVTAKSSKFSGLTGTPSGRGLLTPYVATVVPGWPRAAENGYAAGRGVLTAAAVATQFRETDFLSGRGVLTAQATTIFTGSGSKPTAYELGSIAGRGALTAVAKASKFTGLTGATTGRGALTPYVTTVIPGMPRFSESGYATGRGVLTATAIGNEFRETPTLSGRGALAAQATTIYNPAIGNNAYPLGFPHGAGLLKATAASSKFSGLTGTSTGRGALTVYATTVVPGMPRYSEPGILTGRGVLVATSVGNEFRETPTLSGSGALAAQATTVVYGRSFPIEGLSPQLAGHGALTCVTNYGFDSVGTGFLGVNTPPSFTHTIHGNAIVGFFELYTPTSSGVPTATMSVGGVPMTLLAAEQYYNSGAVYITLFAFGLLNPPTGLQTISATVTNGGSPSFFQGVNTASYNGVLSFGTVTAKGFTVATTEPFVSVPPVANQIVAAAFGGQATNFVGYNQNLRTNQNSAGVNLPMVMGDEIGVTLTNGVMGSARGRGTLSVKTQVSTNAPQVSGKLFGTGTLSAVVSMPVTFTVSNTEGLWGGVAVPMNVQAVNPVAIKFSGLTGTTSGRGQLTPYATTVIPGMPRFAEKVPATGSGVLTATAKAAQFREIDTLSGSGLLTAQATTIFGAGGIASESGPITGRGVLAATAKSSKFSGLTATPSGRGLLVAYVTTVVPGWPRQAENGYATGRGVLTAAAAANQFRETDFLSGRGVLTIQASTIFTGAGSKPTAYELGATTGRGALTAVANASKFSGLASATAGRGLLVCYVTTVNPGMPRFAEKVPATGRGVLSVTAFGNEFRETPALAGRGLLTVYVTTMVAGIKQAIPCSASGRGVLSSTAKTTKAVVTASLSGRGATNSPIGGPSIGSFDQAILNALEDALTGNLTGTLTQLQAAFNDLMALLGSPTALGTGSPVPSGPSSTPLLGTLVSATNSTVANDIFGGSTFWPSLMSLLFPTAGGSVGTAVTSTAVSGLLGPTDIGSSLQASVDSLWNALVSPATYQSGNSLQNLASAAQNLYNTLFGSGAVVSTTTTNSATLVAQALGNQQFAAIDASANAVFPISQLSGTSPTTISVDQADSAVGYILVPTAGVKKTVIWLGRTQGTVSTFVINIYEVNTTTGALNYLFSSPDLHTSLSSSLGWNYWNITNAVSVDAVGAGYNSGTGTAGLLAWSHTIGANATMLLVNVSVNGTGGIGYTQGGTGIMSASCGGVSMTLLAHQNCGNGNNGYNAIFYLATPPIGTQTIDVFFGNNYNVSANSVSFNGVASLGTPVTNFGTSTSPTTGAVTSASGNMVFAGFSGNYNSFFSAPSGTSQYNWPLSANASEQPDMIQTAAGAASVTTSATLSSSKPWSAIGVNLIADNVIGANQNSVYAVEMTLQGTGYYDMVGIPNHWLPVNTNVYPQSLGASRNSYASPVWDANGAGSTNGPATNSLSWSHTNAANCYLIVAVVEYTINGNPTITATYNGVSMTSLGNSLTGSWLKVYLFGLSVTASGTHTVAVSSNQTGYMSGRSTSFTGVTGVGSFTSGSGSSANPSIAQFQNAGDVFFGALGSLNAAITVTAGNNSWIETNTDACLAGAWSPMIQSGATGGFANIAGTMSSTTWASAGIPLLGVEATPGDISAPAYSSDVPWIGMGGTAGITQQVPATTEMAPWMANVDPVTGAYTYTIPTWVINDYNNGQNDLIDVILVGGGSGGDGGTNPGGGAGSWTAVTLTYGTQITGGTTTITGFAGPGGVGGSGTSNGTAGTNSTAVATGYGTITANGGVVNGGVGFFGASPGNQVWNGTTYYGGARETNINYGGTVGAGNAPGGGGSAGGTINAVNYTGGAGASGVVWFVARQPG